MKKYILSAFCIVCMSISLYGQSKPIEWQVSATKVAEKNYLIKVDGTIQNGWHVYAAGDISSGLEPLTFGWEDERIISDGNQKKEQATAILNDPVFNKVEVFQSSFSLSQVVTIEGNPPATVKVFLRGFASNNVEFLPIDETRLLHLEGGVDETRQSLKIMGLDLHNPVASCGDDHINNASILMIFIKGMAGGLLALLMPCLFPMIPVTVSFFTNRSETRKMTIRYGVLYGLSIFLVYLIASVPFHLLSGVNAQIFNSIATNAWVNLAFFFIFVIFALSLFGAFEIRLPAILSNKAGAKSNISSLPGIFFMALTLVIVSFSCTGPILGTLLVGSLSPDGNPWELTAGMAGFGLALAIPFALFAIFPSWLKKLPKSGGWMERLKKTLAFVELALAIKFLSNADLVEHWGLLKREVFISTWIILAGLLGFYLAGAFDKARPIIKVAHPKSRLRYIRPVLATLSFLFAAYLFPGITYSQYANLKLLSGFPPPLSYSIYGKNNIEGKGVEPDVVNDYDKALQLAKQTGKPLLIDFTGWACVNCRKMEEQVWTTSSIARLIKEKFILVSLYVDDRQKLPADQQLSHEDKQIKTVGDKWAAFQAVNFGAVSQPLYIILDPDEKLMNRPVGYSSAPAYMTWLKCGLAAFLNQQRSQ